MNTVDSETARANQYPQVVRVRAHTFAADVGRTALDRAIAACPIHKLMTTTDVEIETLAH